MPSFCTNLLQPTTQSRSVTCTHLSAMPSLNRAGRTAAPCPGINRLDDSPPKITLPTASTAINLVRKPLSEIYSEQPRIVPHVLVEQKRYSPRLCRTSAISCIL